MINKRKSPFDIRGINTQATTDDILHAVKESRFRSTHVFLKEKDFDAFKRALKTPVEDNPALKKLLATKAPWEKNRYEKNQNKNG